MLVIKQTLGPPRRGDSLAGPSGRAGAGGQNVNKVASAVQLFFDVGASSTLPTACRARLLSMRRSPADDRGGYWSSRLRNTERRKRNLSGGARAPRCAHSGRPSGSREAPPDPTHPWLQDPPTRKQVPQGANEIPPQTSIR